MDRKSTPEELRRWAEAWKSAGAYLEEERGQRLRAMTDDDVRRIVADLFEGYVPPPCDPYVSGLVEMQRLLHGLK